MHPTLTFFRSPLAAQGYIGHDLDFKIVDQPGTSQARRGQNNQPGIVSGREL